MGKLALDQGDQGLAVALFQQCITDYKEIKWLTFSCLEGLAAVAMRRGDGERAARQWGAVEAWRAAANVPIGAFEAKDYERWLVAARATLDEVSFAAAWAAGRSLSQEQATAEALRMALEAQPAAGATTPTSQTTGAMPDRLSMLTPRERQVLALLAQGASNRAIADALVIAERTAEIHVSNILSKLGVTSRTQAAAFALAQGLAAPPEA
jgi:DNA-binding CsgD family transcriptional regulator